MILYLATRSFTSESKQYKKIDVMPNVTLYNAINPSPLYNCQK